MSKINKLLKLIESMEVQLDDTDKKLISDFKNNILDIDKKITSVDSYTEIQKMRDLINKHSTKILNILDSEGDQGIKLNLDYLDSYFSNMLNNNNYLSSLVDTLNDSYDKHSKLKFSESYKSIQDIYSEFWIPLENIFKSSLTKDLDYSNRLVTALNNLMSYSDLLVKLKVLYSTDLEVLKSATKYLSSLDKKFKSDIKNIKDIISDLKDLL